MLYLSNSEKDLIVFTCVVFIVADVIQVGLMFLFFRQTSICEKALIEFHDFLINYKQTPRSKILRKHLPNLSAVVEEDSILEASKLEASQFSSPRSQQTLQSLRLAGSKKKISFIYREPEEEQGSSDDSNEKGNIFDAEFLE
jgi:hypothetical protein